MERELAIIEHSVLTISDKHGIIMSRITQEQSDRISDATIALMEILEEIEHEQHNNQS